MVVHKLAPQPGEYSYVFGGREPMLSIHPGDIVEVSTEDCFGGRVTSPDQLPSQVVPFNEMNPVSGPIAVEGAEPGDLLAVHFVSIVPARKYAVSCVLPRFGALAATHETATLNEPLEERVWFYDIDLESWSATFRARNSDFRLQLPLDPMHGTVGVAPASGEVRLVMTPSTHGGNMDTPEARAGTTLYLPVNVAGAMLSLGDGHARQGEGEVCGTGLESAMNSVIAVDLIKEGAAAWPRLENDEYIMSTGSTRPLEDAYRISQKDLIAWTSDLTGMDLLDSYQLVSQMGLAPAANVCDPNYTMVAKLPKWALQGAQAYGGAHSRLRKTAEDYTSR
ncbi:amidase [Arthrobacter ulcerisalmonis]|nr:acetamidase/formamidase family protein [Arthrobacter ulcerisalmonis]MDQ0663230.1 amidase [Arthrobacter ulcerisalmonis]